MTPSSRSVYACVSHVHLKLTWVLSCLIRPLNVSVMMRALLHALLSEAHSFLQRDRSCSVIARRTPQGSQPCMCDASTCTCATGTVARIWEAIPIKFISSVCGSWNYQLFLFIRCRRMEVAVIGSLWMLVRRTCLFLLIVGEVYCVHSGSRNIDNSGCWIVLCQRFRWACTHTRPVVAKSVCLCVRLWNSRKMINICFQNLQW